MRRTAPALSVAALAGAVVGFAASAAYADPAAEVSPGTVSPGGSVTVEVSCDPVDGDPPDAIDATSQAFEEGTVELKRAVGAEEKGAGPVYRGGATVPPAQHVEGDPDGAGGADAGRKVDGACPAAAGGEGKPWSAALTVAPGSGGAHDGTGGTQDGGGTQDAGGTEGAGEAAVLGSDGVDGGGEAADGTGGTEGGEEAADGGSDGVDGGGEAADGGAEGADGGEEAVDGGSDGADDSGAAEEDGADGGTGSTGSTDGTDGWGGTDGGTGATGRDCAEQPHAGQAAPGAGASRWGSTGSGSGEGGARPEHCPDAAAEHGVRAGAGGAFTDSVPALVAGGLLIAGALGGAVYRLRRGTPGRAG